jgi:hypothetical protein
MTVKPVQAILGSEPHETVAVLGYALDIALRQPNLVADV